MHAKHAVSATRARINAELDALEALIDRALPAEDPGPGVGVPQGRKARRDYWKKNGVRSGLSHDRSITRRFSS